ALEIVRSNGLRRENYRIYIGLACGPRKEARNDLEVQVAVQVSVWPGLELLLQVFDKTDVGVQVVLKSWPLSRRVSYEAQHGQRIARAIGSQTDVVRINQARLGIDVVAGAG